MSHLPFDEDLEPHERDAALLAARIRAEGVQPLLELALNDGDASLARAALTIVCESDPASLVEVAFDAARRVPA